MVVFIRDLGNKFISFSSNTHLLQTFKLPTVLPLNNAEMDILIGFIPDNYNKVKGRTSSPKAQVFRDSSMSSTKFSIVYHKRMKHNNTINEDIDIDDNSLVLSYETSQKKAIQVSKTANSQTNTLNKYVIFDHFTSNPQCIPVKYPNSASTHGDLNKYVIIKYPTLSPPCVQTTYPTNNIVINIQLLYDLNAPIESKL